jgi:hypothetical protein
MNREKLLPAKMNALWFTYVAIFLFALLPNFGPELSLFQIFAVSAAWMVFVNLWSMYNEKPIMDERKQAVATEGMAWGFIVVSLLLVPMGNTGVEIDTELVRSTAEMGLWTFLIYFSVKSLWQKHGGDEG